MKKHHRSIISPLRIFERYLWRMVTAFTTVVVGIVMVKFFLFNAGQVNGVSMEPTFYDNDRFLINRVVYWARAPRRYDVVQVIDPQSGKLLIKRIIGLPGETVLIKQGKVFVEGPGISAATALREKYLSESTYTKIQGQRGVYQHSLGQDEYFVLGDHRDQSTDSRVYGGVHRSRILGKVMGKI